MIKPKETIKPQIISSNKKILFNPKEKPKEKIIHKFIRMVSGAISYMS